MSLAERKSWALRQGNALWLWPEVSPRDWHAAMVEIERACSAVLGARDRFRIEGDPQAVGLAAYTSGMGPLLGWWLERGLISTSSAALADVCLHQLKANSERMEFLLGKTREIAARLRSNEIEMTVLKGAHTASAHFPHSGCRPMSDIDILVKPEDAGGAGRVLAMLGCCETSRTSLESTWASAFSAAEPRTLFSLEADDPWSVDLHVSLDIPGPPGARRARLSEVRAKTAASTDVPGCRQLAQPMLLLHLAAHAGSGFHSLTMLRLAELILVARNDRAAGLLHWDEFLELGARTGGLAFAYPALTMARCLSPDDIPQAVVERCARDAPPAIRRLLRNLPPAMAHRIDRPTLREHFAWTRGPGGWLRRIAADVVPEPGSWRLSAAIYGSRARALWRQGITRPQA